MTGPVTVSGRISTVNPLGAGVRAIHIELKETVAFLPGQYLEILHPEGSGIPFSIASTPAELPALTLHYLAQPDSADAGRMDAILAGDGALELRLPFGDCGMTAPLARPLLALAGGSGIAQVRSILHALLPGSRTPVRLYWGVAQADDLYLRPELDALARQHPHFEWIGVTEASAEEASLRHGRVGDAVAADIEGGRLVLADWDVLLAGGPPMVWGTVDVLAPHGLQREQTRADVFSYAPRDDGWGSQDS